MDLLIWLCGCTLALLLPSAVKAAEGGKFDNVAARLKPSVTLDVKEKNFLCQVQTACFRNEKFSIRSMKVNSGKPSLCILSLRE